MTQHPEFSALIPWYVNGTIDDRKRKHLEAHLSQCTACSADMQFERRIREDMTADPGVEYMPAPSLNRLRARLDALDMPGGAADIERAAVAPRVHRAMPWKSLMAASVVMIALALGLFTMNRLPHAPTSPQKYFTVTSPVPRAPDVVIRAVFVPTITLVELQSILDESQLRIVAGPTEAGVYSLAAKSDRSVTASLDALRKHAAVRFAESTRLDAAPDEPR